MRASNIEIPVRGMRCVRVWTGITTGYELDSKRTRVLDPVRAKFSFFSRFSRPVLIPT
jgi:hypothetical protein